MNGVEGVPPRPGHPHSPRLTPSNGAVGMDSRGAMAARPHEPKNEGIRLPGISAILSPAPEPGESRPSRYGYGGVSPNLEKPSRDGPLFSNPHPGYPRAVTSYPHSYIFPPTNGSPGSSYHSGSPGVYHAIAVTQPGYAPGPPPGSHASAMHVAATTPQGHASFAPHAYPTPKQEFEYPRAQAGMTPGYDPNRRPASPHMSQHGLHGKLISVSRPETPPAGSAGPNQYMGQQFVNGKGLCHVFADGGTMRTHINGEPVNPQWGITKAGKPRKRLAQACITCREKKIKCEPGLNKCAQCQKLNKECKRADDIRSSPEQGAPHENGVDSGTTSPREEAPAPTPSNSHVRSTSQTASKKRPPTPPSLTSGEAGQASPVSPSVSDKKSQSQPLPKKPRLHHLETSEMVQQPLGFFVTKRDDDQSRELAAEADGEDDVSMWNWESDPWLVNAKKTDYLLNLYFNSRGSGCYTTVPRDIFYEWLKDERNKSREEMMLLYAMLAVGSVFTTDSEDRSLGERLASIAKFAEHELWAQFSPMLVQTRLYLMFYAFSRGRLCDAWELAGSGFRALAALKYNTEEGVNKLPAANDKGKYEFGLNQVQAIDFRRRVFWIGYTMDRFTGYCSDQIGVLKDEDIFLRLPLHKENYCGGIDATTPYFNAGRPQKIRQELGGMASVVLICSIWGEVMATAYRYMNRTEDRPDEQYASKLDAFHTQISERIKEWETNLPRPLRYNPENTQANLKSGMFSTYFVLHSIRAIAGMTLNRVGRAELLPSDMVQRHITEAIVHARRLLMIVSTMSKQERAGRNPDVENACSQPFPAFAVLNACDVVMCGGEIDDGNDTGKLVNDALVAVNEIGRFWSEARTQSKWMESRRLDMQTYGKERDHRFWRLQKQMKGALLRREHDLLYNAPSEVFFEAIKKAHTTISVRSG